MKRIVETLLEAGIDESMIHRVLDLIEEEYEVVSEVSDDTVRALWKGRKEAEKKADDKLDYMNSVGNTALQKAKKSGDKEKVAKIKDAIDNAEMGVVNATSKRLRTQQAINKRQRRQGRPEVDFYPGMM